MLISKWNGKINAHILDVPTSVCCGDGVRLAIPNMSPGALIFGIYPLPVDTFWT